MQCSAVPSANNCSCFKDAGGGGGGGGGGGLANVRGLQHENLASGLRPALPSVDGESRYPPLGSRGAETLFHLATARKVLQIGYIPSDAEPRKWDEQNDFQRQQGVRRA